MSDKKRIVVTGAGGRLGAALARLYAGQYEVVGLTRQELDLSGIEVRQKLAAVPFDVLINCAALTNVDYCETHEAEAMRINAEAVGEIASYCRETGARMLHISTDYVFDGEKPGAYTEQDAADPVSIYGRSKRAGELALLAADPSHLAIRVSWVFGPDRPSFVDQVVQRALQTDDLAAVGDKDSTPAFTLDLARYLEPLFTTHAQVGGILHLANRGVTTWREYAEHAVRCAQAAGAPVKGTSVRALKISDMVNFVAKRPVHSAMDTSLYEKITGVRPRDWQDAVEDYMHHYAPVTASYRK